MKRIKSRKYNYFYKITNNINNHFYYGIHSTDNLEDGYMGSGIRLNYAYKKYGVENFTKEILKYFDTREEASEYEAEMVTEELVKDRNCYNCTLGGDSFNTSGMVVCYDSVEQINKLVTQEEYHNNARYSYPSIGVINKSTGDKCVVPLGEFYINRGLYSTSTDGKVCTKDKNGKHYLVSVNDPRYLSGELKAIWVGRKHKQEDIDKVKETFRRIGHQQGKKNSNYGKCWITKNYKSISIDKKEINKYLSDGWVKGRCVAKKEGDEPYIPKIKECISKGYSARKISKELNLSIYTVRRILKYNGLSIKKRDIPSKYEFLSYSSCHTILNTMGHFKIGQKLYYSLLKKYSE